jgi:hypothetical protein
MSKKNGGISSLIKLAEAKLRMWDVKLDKFNTALANL